MDSQQLKDKCVCPALYPIVESEKICAAHNLKMSDSTNKFILKLLLKKLGHQYAHSLIRKMVHNGNIEYDPDEEFQVERILDHTLEDGTDWYLVKWKGWDRSHNSWQPSENLSCPDLIKAYHKRRPMPKDDDFTAIGQILDQILKPTKQVTPLQLLRASDSPCNKILSGTLSTKPRQSKRQHVGQPSNPQKRRKFVQQTLKEWETKLNSIITDPAGITVENKVDLEGPPCNFEYINDYKAGEGVNLNEDPVVGCDCETCCDGDDCCPANAGVDCAYDRWGRLRVQPGCPIYECNKMCKCGPDCHNRVVQKGRQCKLCIFRAADGRGWGVRTPHKIKKGTFVMEYLGEIITSEEAEQRGKVYDAEGMTYLFDLDYQDQENPFTVDAGFCGNISHFVNHSCDPNLIVYGVWINNLDPRLPRIAFFAKRDIQRGEELTFDYTVSSVQAEDSMEDEDDVIILDEDPALTARKDTPKKPSSQNSTVNSQTHSDCRELDDCENTNESHNTPLRLSNEDSQLQIIDLGMTSEGETADLPDKHPSPKLPVGSPVKPIPSIQCPSKITSPRRFSDASSAYVRPPLSTTRRRIRCLCGSKKCKKFIF